MKRTRSIEITTYRRRVTVIQGNAAAGAAAVDDWANDLALEASAVLAAGLVSNEDPPSETENDSPWRRFLSRLGYSGRANKHRTRTHQEN